MTLYNFPGRPEGAIPPVVLSDDDVIRAQARARKERSDAFVRAVRWGTSAIRRFTA